VTVVVVLEHHQYRHATTTSTSLRLVSVHTSFIVGGAAALTRSSIAIADKKITRKHYRELDIDIGNGPVLLNRSRPRDDLGRSRDVRVSARWFCTVWVPRRQYSWPGKSSGQPGGSGSEGSSRL
jgi:hypothetical protein